jgi:hypothetical protein
MDLRAIGLRGVDWIRLAQDRDRWRAVVSAVMKLQVQVYTHTRIKCVDVKIAYDYHYFQMMMGMFFTQTRSSEKLLVTKTVFHKMLSNILVSPCNKSYNNNV